MSFTSLPNETLQRIVDLCHEADETYRKRMKNPLGEKPESTEEDFLKDPCKAWRGRSCSAISMVNKRLRSMAIKYIFTTLRTSKAHEGIFQWTILGFDTGNCIRNLIFDDSRSRDVCSFVCNTLPRLPNLRCIKGLVGWVARGIHLIPQLISQPPSWFDGDVVTLVAARRAGEALLQIASRIKEWELEKKEEEAELLLSRNYDGIESLALVTHQSWGHPILESETSKFPALLSKCSNLRSLSIIQAAEDFDGDFDEPIAKSVLSITFAFAASLRSLSLNLERYGGRTTENEFLFITLFPSLDTLKMVFRSDNLDEIKGKSYLLPKLSSLEILDCPFIHMHVLFRCLLLPSISSIHLSHTRVPQLRPSRAQRYSEIRLLVPHLKAYFSTLRTLHLNFFINLPPRAVDHLLPLADTIDISILPKPMPPKRKRFPSSGSYDEEDIESEISDNESLPRSYPEKLMMDGDRGGEEEKDNGFKATKELVDWAQERVYSCGTVDDVGLQEMRRFLEPIRDLKEWIED